jgi:MerR family mercuric resistance operon transcriptional regulator
LELLSLRADDGAACADVRARAEAKLDEVRDRVRGLRRMESALKTLIAACPGEGPVQQCTILDAIAQSPAPTSGKSSQPGA